MVMPPSAEFIYNDLIRRITDMSLEPGSKISENRIGEEYNVSRSVIRSVFARLSQIHFLEIYPQRGTFVTKINLEYIHSILIMRLAIEKEMLERFMEIEEKGDILRKLQENVNQQRKFSKSTKYIDEFKKLDEEFHGLIMGSVGKQNILLLMNEHLLHINRWRNLSVGAGIKMQELIDEHQEILNSIKDGDLNRLNEVIAVHIVTVCNTTDEWLEKYEDYFEDYHN